jgi:hypothetical protein
MACLATAVALASGCGGGDTFDAEEFVAAVNEEGANLVLGDELHTEQPEVETYQVRFARVATGQDEAQEGAPSAADAHGAGSLIVTPDEETAQAEYDRCEAALSFTCFRAANVALFMTGTIPLEDLASLEEAFRGLASE